MTKLKTEMITPNVCGLLRKPEIYYEIFGLEREVGGIWHYILIPVCTYVIFKCHVL